MDGCGEGSGTNRLMVEKLSLSCDRLLSHLQLACCPSHCASPLQGKDLLIHCLLDTELKVSYRQSYSTSWKRMLAERMFCFISQPQSHTHTPLLKVTSGEDGI